MTTRYGPEQQSHDWAYPTAPAGFLDAVRADPADDYDTRMRIEMFMMTPVARRMPVELRKALVDAGVLTGHAKPRLR
jgi:hypothetical protein